MIRGDDPAPWNLLVGGTIAAIDGDEAATTMSIEVPLVDNRTVRFVLAGLERLWHWPSEWPRDDWDRAELEEPAAIAERRLRIEEAIIDRGEVRVFTHAGNLGVRYASLAVELDTGAALALADLRAIVHAWWLESRPDTTAVHREIRAILDGRPLRDSLEPLLAAWRTERTSELAGALAIVDERTRGPAPVRLGSDDSYAAWRETWSREPGAALAELARCAQLTFELPPDKWTADRVVGPCSQAWLRLRDCAGALRSAAPDPRIGRGIEAALASPSSGWFMHDDAGWEGRTGHRDPSFADHATTLLDAHADAGSARRLRGLADVTTIEADCNGAEMTSLLRSLADIVAERYPDDVELSDSIALGLRSR